ncbi:Lrp/AsnC family transcriptional regulator [Roseibium sp. SCP14]|uniref:Lrp/AsnC family transcriptional regulator n=1 Tax=Roseibium sp. SCP14 TaxID=3141375 RepID=UPI00333DEF59
MLDTFDLKILNLVQHNNRLTSEEIGAQVGLSASACQRRLTRMRDNGTIRSDIAVIDPGKVGKKLTLIIDVTLEREGAQEVSQFKAAMRKNPTVMQCYSVTGQSDFILIISVCDMQEFEEFQEEFCRDNPMVKRFSTNVVVDSVKVGLALYLDEDSP